MSEGDEPALDVERRGTVAVIRLDRPKTLNAITTPMIHELCDQLNEYADDDEVRVVVLAGKGRAFSSGYDLSDLDEYVSTGPVALREASRHVHKLIESVWRFPKPIIAAVHGYCLAGACEIAMLCDLTIAAESCQFGEPEIRFSSASPTLIMPWLVPMKIAKELLLSGAMIDAARAYEIGMVNQVVPDQELMKHALRRARVIAQIAPLGARLTKEGINATYNIMGLQNALQHNNLLAAMLDGTGTEELNAFSKIAAQEGLKAALKWRDEQFRIAESDDDE